MAQLGSEYGLVYASPSCRNIEWLDLLVIDGVKQNGDFGGHIYEFLGEERGTTPLHDLAGHYDDAAGLIRFHDIEVGKEGSRTISFSGTVISNNNRVNAMWGTFHELTFHSGPGGTHRWGNMRTGPWVGVGSGDAGRFFGI